MTTISTFCRFGLDRDFKFDDTSSHQRCRNAGIACDCECHGKRTQEPQGADVTTIAEHRHDTDAPDHTPEPAKRARRVWTDADKRRILAEIDTSPTKKSVLDKYQLSPSVVMRWQGQIANGHEAPPDPEEPVAQDPVDDVELVLEEAFELTILVSAEERDVLDALGFLDGHGDATGYLVQLVSNLCVEAAGESDVKLVLAARRGRAVEA